MTVQVLRFNYYGKSPQIKLKYNSLRAVWQRAVDQEVRKREGCKRLRSVPSLSLAFPDKECRDSVSFEININDKDLHQEQKARRPVGVAVLPPALSPGTGALLATASGRQDTQKLLVKELETGGVKSK